MTLLDPGVQLSQEEINELIALRDNPERRQVGRVPPPVEEAHIEIYIDGQVVGTVYPGRLTGAAQFDLEDAQTTRQVIRWLVLYAGGDAEAVEAILRPLPLIQVTEFVRSVARSLSKSLELSKKNGSAS